MKIDEFKQKNGEGLKNLGAVFWILSKIETQLITQISFFFTDWSKVSPLKSILLNRALFDEKIFSTTESKRLLFKRIIEGLHDEATRKGVSFDKNKYMSTCDLINKTQEIRNVLAHNLVFFSDDGQTATYSDARKMNKEKRVTVNLVDEIAKAETISNLLEQSFADFVNDAVRVVNSPEKN